MKPQRTCFALLALPLLAGCATSDLITVSKRTQEDPFTVLELKEAFVTADQALVIRVAGHVPGTTPTSVTDYAVDIPLGHLTNVAREVNYVSSPGVIPGKRYVVGRPVIRTKTPDARETAKREFRSIPILPEAPAAAEAVTGVFLEGSLESGLYFTYAWTHPLSPGPHRIPFVLNAVVVRHPQRYKLVMLPVTVAVDVVTLPLQAIGVVVLAAGMSGQHSFPF